MNQNLIDYINNQTVIVQESTDKTEDLVFFKVEIKEDTSAVSTLIAQELIRRLSNGN